MKRHTSGEDYLEAILILQKTKDSVHAIDVAHFLNFSRPSVSNAVSVLKNADLIDVRGDYSLHLTKSGREIAERIYSRHCFFRDLLIASGVDEKIAAEDACRLEHAISEDSFQKLKAKVSFVLDEKE